MKKFFKFLYFSIFILFLLFAFSSCAKADSLNISDFEHETFISPLNSTQRTCNQQQNIVSGASVVSFSCTINFNNTEWNNNFSKENYNFILYPINHSAYSFYNNDEEVSDGISQSLVSHVYIVDYTLKIYLKDINDKIYNCDIINNNIGACRYDRDVKVNSMTVELIFFGVKSIQQANFQIGSSLYFQSQYYLTSYRSMTTAITSIENDLTDSSIDTSSMGGTSSDWESKSASNGTITNLLTLPISFIQKFLTGFSGSCSTFTLGNIFDTTLTLPCINLKNVLGNALWSTIDVLISGLMIFAIGKKLVKIFNDFTNLKDNQINDLYGGGA